MRSYFRKIIALPQDHGSWVFILSPLLVGLFAAGRLSLDSLCLVLAAMAVFMLRQPITVLVKALSGRRARTDMPAAWFWIAVYASMAGACLLYLTLHGFFYILLLAIPGLPVFAWHLWLVSRRAERRQAGVEIIASGVLALAAPAVYWVGLGSYNPSGWWLWILTWLQSAASIVYAYLRLEQREFDAGAVIPFKMRWKMGGRALLYTTFNLGVALALGMLGHIPLYLFGAFLIQWAETVWGIVHPASGWKASRIGLRQLIVTILWTAAFITGWRFS